MHQKLYANIFSVPYFFLKWAGMMYCNSSVCEGHGKDCYHHIIVKRLNEIIGDSLGLSNDATSRPTDDATLKGIGHKHAGGVKWKT